MYISVWRNTYYLYIYHCISYMALIMWPPMRIGLSKCSCVYKDICVHLFQRIYICTYACHYVCGCRCLYVFDNVCMYANAYIYLFVNVIGATSSWGHWIYRHICAQDICLDSVYLIHCLLPYYQRIQNVCERISRSMCLKPTFYIFQHTWCLDCVYLLLSYYHVINEIKMYVKALAGLCVISLRFIFSSVYEI